jgi:hypothetical protein
MVKLTTASTLVDALSQTSTDGDFSAAQTALSTAVELLERLRSRLSQDSLIGLQLEQAQQSKTTLSMYLGREASQNAALGTAFTIYELNTGFVNLELEVGFQKRTREERKREKNPSVAAVKGKADIEVSFQQNALSKLQGLRSEFTGHLMSVARTPLLDRKSKLALEGLISWGEKTAVQIPSESDGEGPTLLKLLEDSEASTIRKVIGSTPNE